MFSRPKFYYQHASYFHLNNYMGFDVPKEDYLTGGLDPKVKDVKNWVQNGDSSPEAKALAKALQTELETIKNSTDKKLIELYAEVFENIGIKDNYDAKEGQPIVVDDTYDKKGVLSVLEQNCPMLKVQFSLYPDHRYLAYASATKAASNIDYLPMGSTITLLDGVVTVTRPMKDAEGKEKMETVSFELFPWDVQKAMEAKAKAIEAKAAAKEAEVDLGGSGVGAQNVTPSGETPAETQAPGVGPELNLSIPGETVGPNPEARPSGELGGPDLNRPTEERGEIEATVKPLGTAGPVPNEGAEEEKRLMLEERMSLFQLVVRDLVDTFEGKSSVERMSIVDTVKELDSLPKRERKEVEEALWETLDEAESTCSSAKKTYKEIIQSEYYKTISPDQKKSLAESYEKVIQVELAVEAIREKLTIKDDKYREQLKQEQKIIDAKLESIIARYKGVEISLEPLNGRNDSSQVITLYNPVNGKHVEITLLIPKRNVPTTYMDADYKVEEVGPQGDRHARTPVDPKGKPIVLANFMEEVEFAAVYVADSRLPKEVEFEALKAEKAQKEAEKAKQKQPQPSNESTSQ